ncbi:restriction endonuclease, partial [Rhizoctonia solani AG-3 Rhs1AP]
MAAAVPKPIAVFVGRAFELRSLSLLQSRLSMTLAHVGSRGDGGVDLQGWWWVPRLDDSKDKDRRAVRVLAQCKASKSKLGPIHVRELEGAALVHQHSFAADAQDSSITGTKPQDLVAMIISLSGFTSYAIKRAMASPVPFLLLHLPAPVLEGETETPQPLPPPTTPDSSTEPGSNSIGSIIWNFQLAGATGLLGGHMEVRWALGQQRGQEAQVEGGRPVLYWKGKKLDHWIPETQEIGERFSGGL